MKSKTPIFDFLEEYAKANGVRLHMPGHKGKGLLGVEKYDLTEIDGADSLFEANGIIAQSEENCSKIFGAKTYYSTEGSSLSIRAMVYLALQHAKKIGRKPLIFAGRNCHKTFLSALALLDVKVEWLYPENFQNYLSCEITPTEIEKSLKGAKELPVAVYLTSPDYLGNIAPIGEISRICKKYGVLLMVDNAHGGYLKFLEKSLFPIDLGADTCCSSAHKTLPVLTGGGYLHLSNEFANNCDISPKQALSLFASTSPSYLILASLDLANMSILDGLGEDINRFEKVVLKAKTALISHGYCLVGNEPLKITVRTKSYGYTGFEISQILRKKGIICEFCDPDFITFMFSVDNGEDGVKILVESMLLIPRKEEIKELPPKAFYPKTALDIRTAVLSLHEEVKTEDCLGRVLGLANLSCPPAVPIVSCGEIIDENAIKTLKYYGIKTCVVVKK